MARTKKDTLTKDTTRKGDLKSDTSKRTSTTKTTKECTVAVSAKKGNGRKKSKVVKCDASASIEQKEQPAVKVSKKSKKDEKCDILTARKQTGTPLDNVSKESKKCEKFDLSASGKKSETLSGNVTKTCDITAPGKITQKHVGNVSKQCDIPESVKGKQSEALSGNVSKKKKCDRSASGKKSRIRSGNVTKTCDITAPGKITQKHVGNVSKQCDIPGSVKVKQSEALSGNVSKKKKCDRSASGKKSIIRSGNVTKTCDIGASGKLSEKYLGDVSKQCDIPGSGKLSGTPSGSVSKKKKSDTSDPEKAASTSKKKEIKLRPSDIRYSQASISSQFKDGANIGQLLDDIYFGRCFASALSLIEVSHIKDQWVSADNRRLWVFKQLELVGRVDFITVKVTKTIYTGKLTSENKGLDVETRNGEPKGIIYSLIKNADSKGNIDECLTNDAESAPERKPKRKRCRRRRKAKVSGTNSGNIGQNENRSEVKLEGSCDLNSSSANSDVSQDYSAVELDTLLQYDQSLVDENTYFEIYTYSESEDWMDRGYHLNEDAALFEGNAVSAAESQNDWFDYESETEADSNEDVTNTAFAEKKSRTETIPTYFDNYGLQDDFEYSLFGMQAVDNIGHIETIFDDRNEHYIKQNATANNYDRMKSIQMPDMYNPELADDSDAEFDDFEGTCQAETDYLYRPNKYSDICFNSDCARCSRMLFYTELDKGPYYEPPCGRARANHSRPSHGSVSTGIFTNNVKKNSDEKTFLSKVSHGIGVVVGFLNKIFN